jgi:hypothetical protein
VALAVVYYSERTGFPLAKFIIILNLGGRGIRIVSSSSPLRSQELAAYLFRPVEERYSLSKRICPQVVYIVVSYHRDPPLPGMATMEGNTSSVHHKRDSQSRLHLLGDRVTYPRLTSRLASKPHRPIQPAHQPIHMSAAHLDRFRRFRFAFPFDVK